MGAVLARALTPDLGVDNGHVQTLKGLGLIPVTLESDSGSWSDSWPLSLCRLV